MVRTAVYYSHIVTASTYGTAPFAKLKLQHGSSFVCTFSGVAQKPSLLTRHTIATVWRELHITTAAVNSPQRRAIFSNDCPTSGLLSTTRPPSNMRAPQNLSALALLALLACAQLGASAGRVLLNPVHDSSLTLTGPATPKAKASLAHTPASVASSINIRSEKPYVTIDHSEPGPKIVAGGETAVDTVQGPTFKHSTGKTGVQMRFDSGKRAFEVTHSSTVTANFPATAVEVGSGTPLAVQASHSVTGPAPNSTLAISAGDGPSARHSWSVNLGPGMGRRM